MEESILKLIHHCSSCYPNQDVYGQHQPDVLSDGHGNSDTYPPSYDEATVNNTMKYNVQKL